MWTCGTPRIIFYMGEKHDDAEVGRAVASLSDDVCSKVNVAVAGVDASFDSTLERLESMGYRLGFVAACHPGEPGAPVGIDLLVPAKDETQCFDDRGVRRGEGYGYGACPRVSGNSGERRRMRVALGYVSGAPTDEKE